MLCAAAPGTTKMYACLYQPAAPDGLHRGARFAVAGARHVQAAPDAASDAGNAADALVAVAQEFSPRFERHRDRLVSIDVTGLDRLVGPPRTIGDELRRTAA